MSERSTELSPASPAAVVRTLRAAGCVFAEEEAELLIGAAPTSTELDELVARRAAGAPLEQVLGWAQFCGLRVAVQPGVFVPRRRTELLVRVAAELARQAVPGRTVVVDLCCGSGAVGVALDVELTMRLGAGQVELHAVDLDPVAVRCARGNLAGSGSANPGRVYEGDLYAPLPTALRGRVDVLIANAPYVPTEGIAEMPREAREHEPRLALDGGADGLDVQRRVVASAPRWLAPTGLLLIESSERQAPRLVETVTAVGLTPRIVGDDELGATVVLAEWPATTRVI